jgi:hypothetical protein
MLNHFINRYVKVIALFSLGLAMLGAVVMHPAPATAASCNGMIPVPCSHVTILVVDKATGMPVGDAIVALVDENGNSIYAYRPYANPVNDGRYLADVLPGHYTAIVVAQNYFRYTTDAPVNKPGENVFIEAPLATYQPPK